MSFKIIFMRKGKKRMPFFNICVKNTVNNRILDKLGTYEPLGNINKENNTKKKIVLNLKKYYYWLHKGTLTSKFLLNYTTYFLTIKK